MASGKRLIAVGVAALVVGLVATFPARIAYQWFAPAGLTLSGISGSVWNGKAAQGSAAGMFLTDLTWQFRPLSLLSLKAGYAVSASLPSGFIETDVAFRAGNRIAFSDLATAVPLATFAPLLPLAGIEGDISLQLKRLVLVDGFPAAADGTVSISGLVLRALSRSALGDYRAELQTGDGAIGVVVEDVSGVLDMDGNLVLQDDGNYSFVGKVAAKADASSAIVEQIGLLGRPDPQGRREFRFEGTL